MRKIYTLCINKYTDSSNNLKGCINDGILLIDTFKIAGESFTYKSLVDSEVTVLSFKQVKEDAVGGHSLDLNSIQMNGMSVKVVTSLSTQWTQSSNTSSQLNYKRIGSSLLVSYTY